MKRKILQTVPARVAIVLVLAATAAIVLLFANTRALAGKPNPYEFSGPLYNVGDEPRAKGTFTEMWSRPVGDPVPWTAFYVTCTKLTPEASYILYVDLLYEDGTLYWEKQVPFSADRRGAALTGTVFQGEQWPVFWFSLRVCRLDGSNPVLVLAYPRP